MSRAGQRLFGIEYRRSPSKPWIEPPVNLHAVRAVAEADAKCFRTDGFECNVVEYALVRVGTFVGAAAAYAKAHEEVRESAESAAAGLEGLGLHLQELERVRNAR